MYYFPHFRPICCSISSSVASWPAYISQEAGQMVWYSHFFKYFPQFVVIHAVKGFSVDNGTEVDVFFFQNSWAFSVIQHVLEEEMAFHGRSHLSLMREVSWITGTQKLHRVVPWTQIDRVWGECRFGEVLVRAWPWGRRWSEVLWSSPPVLGQESEVEPATLTLLFKVRVMDVPAGKVGVAERSWTWTTW